MVNPGLHEKNQLARALRQLTEGDRDPADISCEAGINVTALQLAADAERGRFLHICSRAPDAGLSPVGNLREEQRTLASTAIAQFAGKLTCLREGDEEGEVTRRAVFLSLHLAHEAAVAAHIHEAMFRGDDAERQVAPPMQLAEAAFLLRGAASKAKVEESCSDGSMGDGKRALFGSGEYLAKLTLLLTKFERASSKKPICFWKLVCPAEHLYLQSSLEMIMFAVRLASERRHGTALLPKLLEAEEIRMWWGRRIARRVLRQVFPTATEDERVELHMLLFGEGYSRHRGLFFSREYAAKLRRQFAEVVRGEESIPPECEWVVSEMFHLLDVFVISGAVHSRLRHVALNTLVSEHGAQEAGQRIGAQPDKVILEFCEYFTQIIDASEATVAAVRLRLAQMMANMFAQLNVHVRSRLLADVFGEQVSLPAIGVKPETVERLLEDFIKSQLQCTRFSRESTRHAIELGCDRLCVTLTYLASENARTAHSWLELAHRDDMAKARGAEGVLNTESIGVGCDGELNDPLILEAGPEPVELLINSVVVKAPDRRLLERHPTEAGEVLRLIQQAVLERPRFRNPLFPGSAPLLGNEEMFAFWMIPMVHVECEMDKDGGGSEFNDLSWFQDEFSSDHALFRLPRTLRDRIAELLKGRESREVTRACIAAWLAYCDEFLDRHRGEEAHIVSRQRANEMSDSAVEHLDDQIRTAAWKTVCSMQANKVAKLSWDETFSAYLFVRLALISSVDHVALGEEDSPDHRASMELNFRHAVWTTRCSAEKARDAINQLLLSIESLVYQRAKQSEAECRSRFRELDSAGESKLTRMARGRSFEALAVLMIQSIKRRANLLSRFPDSYTLYERVMRGYRATVRLSLSWMAIGTSPWLKSSKNDSAGMQRTNLINTWQNVYEFARVPFDRSDAMARCMMSMLASAELDANLILRSEWRWLDAKHRAETRGIARLSERAESENHGDGGEDSADEKPVDLRSRMDALSALVHWTSREYDDER